MERRGILAGEPELSKPRAQRRAVAKRVISPYYLPNMHHLIHCQLLLPPLRLATPPLPACAEIKCVVTTVNGAPGTAPETLAVNRPSSLHIAFDILGV